MVSPKESFSSLINRLAEHYGEPQPPSITDPLQLILWENVAYLLPDAKREIVYSQFKSRIGLSPQSILAAPDKTLLEVASLGGMRPPERVEKFLTIAQLALQEMPRGTAEFLAQPLAKIRKALKKFPGIGDPGADRIMLFAGVECCPTFDSNGLRVLQRLGLVLEEKNYSASYREAQKVVREGAPALAQPAYFIRSYQLLRQHGQELCKNNAPRCYDCPMQNWCAYHLKADVSKAAPPKRR